MRCKELFSLLSEFIDRELGDDLCGKLQAHLSSCEPCKALLQTLQKAVDICKELPQEPVPEQVRLELKLMMKAEMARMKKSNARKARIT